ncbi:MAG TPA: LysM domain-containing protein [Chloroflexi bacterium]|nr:LysM domain-containing protein [Chloroflexota bacterium]
MIFRRYLIMAAVLVTAVFLLSACVRPGPDSGNGNEEAETPIPTLDPNVGGGIGDPNSPTTDVAEGSVAEPTAVPQIEPTSADVMPPQSPETDTEVGGGVPETQPPAETAPEAAPTVVPTAVPAQPAPTAPPPPETADNTAVTLPVDECNVIHIVQPGQNLYQIGLIYNISWVWIAQANGLADPNQVIVGQELVIPLCGVSNPPPVQPPPSGATYVVQPGDNLFRIGLRYGISWVQIAEANGITNPNQIYVGQVLKIPATQPGPQPNFTHVVQPGETMYSISVKYGVPWQSVAAANNIGAPYTVYAGQTLIIPGSY